MWGRLDELCSWREFAEGVAASGRIASAVAAFSPEAVLGVDWHALGGWQRLQQADSLSAMLASVPYIYLNYRSALLQHECTMCATQVVSRVLKGAPL